MRMAFAFVLLLALPVAAEPLKASNAQDVRVSVAARPQRALGVRATPDQSGWRLQLRAPVEGVAEVFDVTPGTPAITFTLRLVAGLISFDLARFAGGHTYHVAVKSASATGSGTSTGLVYLYPNATTLKQPRRAAATRVRFDEHEAKAPAGSDEIVAEKKGSL
jgi:hypothetical protein